MFGRLGTLFMKMLSCPSPSVCFFWVTRRRGKWKLVRSSLKLIPISCEQGDRFLRPWDVVIVFSFSMLVADIEVSGQWQACTEQPGFLGTLPCLRSNGYSTVRVTVSFPSSLFSTALELFPKLPW